MGRIFLAATLALAVAMGGLTVASVSTSVPANAIGINWDDKKKAKQQKQKPQQKQQNKKRR